MSWKNGVMRVLNKTYLIGDNMRKLDEKERRVITAVLSMIDQELRRCYWNEHHIEMASPFSNTGNQYECRAFKVIAYDWSHVRENFVYPKDGLYIEWYKYLGRGMYVEVPDDWTMERLPDMLDDCIAAIREDFGEVEQ